MARGIKGHTHKLKRFEYKTGPHRGVAQYFCVLDCNYKINAGMVIGKEALCWRCSQPFYMNELSSRLVKPHCLSCTKKRDSDTEEVRIPIPVGLESMKSRLQGIVLNREAQPIDEDEDAL